MSVLKITRHNFEEEVLNSETPVLLDFWAPWCGPCRMLSPLVDELSIEVSPAVKVGKINISEEPELATRFNVMSIPTLAFIKSGEIVGKQVGVQSKQNLLKMLRK